MTDNVKWNECLITAAWEFARPKSDFDAVR